MKSLKNYPTDCITMGQMRWHQPLLFAVSSATDIAQLPEPMAIHRMEQILYAKVSAKTSGKADPFPDFDRHKLIEELNNGYVKFGLSAGHFQTIQLVRQIETAGSQVVPR